MTLEELQQQVLTLQEEMNKVIAERDEIKKNHETLIQEHEKTKQINQELFLKVTTPATKDPEPEPPKPVEDVANEFYFGK